MPSPNQAYRAYTARPFKREERGEVARDRRVRGVRQAELGQRSYAVIKPYLLNDLSALEPQYRDSRKVHLSTGRGGQRAHPKIAECRACMRAAALSLANHVVTIR